MHKRIVFLVWIALLAIVMVSCDNSKPVTDMTRFMGYIENTQVNVTTRIPGRITAIYVDEGDTVKEGEKVAQLDTREILANRSALMAKLRNVEVNRQRIENLYKAGAIAQQSLDEISTNEEMLKAQISAIDINVGDMTITSPLDGIVNVKVLEVNQMMPPGMPVVVVTDPQGTWARFNIPETFINRINLGDTLSLTSSIANLGFKAKVVQILPVADFATHTPTTLRDQNDVNTFDVKMKITSNQMKCKPGMSVYLQLKGPLANDASVR